MTNILSKPALRAEAAAVTEILAAPERASRRVATPPMLAPQIDGGVIHVSTMGNLANQMLQYMAAISIARYSQAARISNVNLPPFGILHPFIPDQDGRVEYVHTPTVPIRRLASALSCGTLSRVDLRTYAQRMENFLPAEAYRAAFRLPERRPASSAAHELLINIRQGDILDGHHPDYVLLPVAFYADLVAETGLAPVFMGQLEDSPYMAALRARFPRARYLPSEGPAVDFARIRLARHIVPAISTFSWLAAWLSEADRIYLPVAGLFNPPQNRGVDLLPRDDPRYRFYHFPIHYSCPVDQVGDAHASIRGLWRFMPPDQLAAILDRVPPPRQKHLYLQAFDEAFYRAVNPDIAAAVAAGHLPSGRDHFERTGFDEGRAGFGLDRGWYCRSYPIAALEIVEGQFHDADQHWLELGRVRGYRRGAAG